MQTIRIWHSYIGVLIAPSVIFFALTGTVQLFSLHEAHGSYTPPVLIEKLASMHKDQVFEQKHHDEPEPEAKSDQQQPPKEQHEQGPGVGTYLLKWFFTLVALALTTSTGMGLWIALKHPVRKRSSWVLLVIGIVLPIALFII